MSPFRHPGTPAWFAAAILVLVSCGRPTLLSQERYTVTVEENQRAGDQIRLVVRRDDCATSRLQLTMAAPGECLARHAVGAKFEIVKAVYKHPAISCGVREGDPRNTIGGCDSSLVSVQELGTACPRKTP